MLPRTTVALFLAGALCWACGPGGGASERSNADGAYAPASDGGVSSGSAPPSAACAQDGDCEPVASSCCECPTYAMPVGSGFGGACEDVDDTCEPMDCPAQEAACSPSGQCELACSPVVCDLSCSMGFVVDTAGCAVCECNTEPAAAPECGSDDDCVEVPADCCGCARGGADTAVSAGAVDEHDALLACSGDEVCPEVDVCSAEAVPSCQFGHCGLAIPSGETIAVCGSATSPTCPPGDPPDTRCVLNAREYPAAALAGLGVCLPP